MSPLPIEARDPETYAIIGAAMAVHAELGCGFLEHAYQCAMKVELPTRRIPFVSQVDLDVRLQGVLLDCKYRADFICYGSIIVEIKALPKLGGIERSQVINYLKATGFHRALLVNFGATSLEYERLVR